MRRLFWPAILCVAACRAMADAGSANPPAAKAQDVVDVYYGVRVDDPYRSMETVNDPAVAVWLKKQSNYTRHILESLPGRSALLETVEALESRIGSRRTCVLASPTTASFTSSANPATFSRSCFSGRDLRGKERASSSLARRRRRKTGNVALHFYSPSQRPLRCVREFRKAARSWSPCRCRHRDWQGAWSTERSNQRKRRRPTIRTGRPYETGYYFNQKQAMLPGMAVTEKFSIARLLYRVHGAACRTPKPIFGKRTGRNRVSPEELPYIDVPRSPDSPSAISPRVRRLVSLYAVQQNALLRSPYLGAVSSASMIRYRLCVYGDDLYVVTERTHRVQGPQASLANPTGHATVVVPEGGGGRRIPPRRECLYVRLLDGGPSRLPSRSPRPQLRAEEIPLPVSGSVRIEYAESDVRRILEIAAWTQARGLYSYEPGESRLTRLDLQPSGPF